MNGDNRFWFGADSELSCHIENGNPVCDLTVPGMSVFSLTLFKNCLDTCAILYDEVNKSGSSEVLSIGEYKWSETLVNSCQRMILDDKSESVFVTPVKGFISLKSELMLHKLCNS